MQNAYIINTSTLDHAPSSSHVEHHYNAEALLGRRAGARRTRSIVGDSNLPSPQTRINLPLPLGGRERKGGVCRLVPEIGPGGAPWRDLNTTCCKTSLQSRSTAAAAREHRRILVPLLLTPITPVPRARRGSPGDGLAPCPPGPHQRLVFYTSQCSTVALGERESVHCLLVLFQ